MEVDVCGGGEKRDGAETVAVEASVVESGTEEGSREVDVVVVLVALTNDELEAALDGTGPVELWSSGRKLLSPSVACETSMTETDVAAAALRR